VPANRVARWDGTTFQALGNGLNSTVRGLTTWDPDGPGPQHELLAHEKELLGFYVTGHPLTPFAPILEKYALANTAALLKHWQGLRSGATVRDWRSVTTVTVTRLS
jgi:DNA polymerase-3 subunit alpha